MKIEENICKLSDSLRFNILNMGKIVFWEGGVFKMRYEYEKSFLKITKEKWKALRAKGSTDMGRKYSECK